MDYFDQYFIKCFDHTLLSTHPGQSLISQKVVPCKLPFEVGDWPPSRAAALFSVSTCAKFRFMITCAIAFPISQLSSILRISSSSLKQVRHNAVSSQSILSKENIESSIGTIRKDDISVHHAKQQRLSLIVQRQRKDYKIRKIFPFNKNYQLMQFTQLKLKRLSLSTIYSEMLQDIDTISLYYSLSFWRP